MAEPKRKLTLDNDTVASTPGNITFNPFVWLKHQPLPFVALTCLTLSLFAFLGVNRGSVIFLGVFYTSIIIYRIIALKEHYSADSNAGIVISTNPPLVAVTTDLAKYDGHYPAFKIIKYYPKRKIRKGERIATVAVYEDNFEDRDYWSDFFPLPAEYATNNSFELKREVSRYPEEQWQQLESAIAHLNPPYKPGLYHINNADSNW